MIVLVNFLLFLYLIRELYLYNIFYIIDKISGFFTYFFIYSGLFNERINIIKNNLNMVFDNIEKKKENDIIFKSVKLFFMNMLYVVNSKIIMKNNLNIKVISKVDNSFIKNKKCIFASCHFGFYYYGCRNFGKVGFLYKNKNKIVDELFYNKTFLKKYDLYPYLSNEMSKFKRDNNIDILLLYCDQVSNRIELKFFNKKYKTHNSPAILAKEMNIPIYVFINKYDFENNIVYQYLEPIKVSNNINDTMQNIFNVFEKYIRNNPEQYFWLHNLFK